MLNWCIIGSGDVVNRLVDNSLNIRGVSKVSAIISSDIIQAKILAKKLNIEKVLINTQKNVKKIQQDSEINSIYIATPPNSHFLYIKKFCKFKKYCL